jgi:hypothetical protein
MANEVDTRIATVATVTAYLVSLEIKMEIEAVTAALEKHAQRGEGDNQYYIHSYSASDTSNTLFLPFSRQSYKCPVYYSTFLVRSLHVDTKAN